MRIRIASKAETEETLLEELKKMGITNQLSEEAKGDVFTRVYDIEPNKYR